MQPHEVLEAPSFFYSGYVECSKPRFPSLSDASLHVCSDSVFIGCLVVIFSVGIGPFTQ